MNWTLISTVGIPGALVVAGWFLAHWLTARRELTSKRREARLKAVEAAYMRIATSSNRPISPDIAEKLETFVSEIQLYGTPHQLELMGALVESFKRGEAVSYDEILVSLRDTIRKELRLEPAKGPVWWFRLTPNPVLSQPAAMPAEFIQKAIPVRDGDA